VELALIASFEYPIAEPFAGGLEKQTYHLAVGLRDRGHDVTVFAAEGSAPELNAEAVCGEGCHFDFSDVAMDDPHAVAEPFMRAHHAYLHLMLRLRERGFDLVQNSSLHHLPVALAPLLPMPLVTTLHNPPTPWLESAIRAQEGPGPVFVSVSHHNAGAWEGIAEVRQVIPNGVDLDLWPFSADAAEDAVVWFGRLVPEKGPNLAVEAAHRAGRRIILAGPLDENGWAESEVLPRLDDGDEYAGHLEQRELAALVGNCGATLVTPCWDEPFGLVAVESLACGTPIAAFDRGAVGEVLDGTGALAPAGDVDALAAAIPDALSIERDVCRRHAETSFSIDVMVDRYESLYRDLVR
jgi:glycosyltransferase involved in cell wall biosynthesis